MAHPRILIPLRSLRQLPCWTFRELFIEALTGTLEPLIARILCFFFFFLLLLHPGDKDRKITFNMTRGSPRWTRTLLARSFIPGIARALGKILEMLSSVAALSGHVNDEIIFYE